MFSKEKNTNRFFNFLNLQLTLINGCVAKQWRLWKSHKSIKLLLNLMCVEFCYPQNFRSNFIEFTLNHSVCQPKSRLVAYMCMCVSYQKSIIHIRSKYEIVGPVGMLLVWLDCDIRQVCKWTRMNLLIDAYYILNVSPLHASILTTHSKSISRNKN